MVFKLCNWIRATSVNSLHALETPHAVDLKRLRIPLNPCCNMCVQVLREVKLHSSMHHESIIGMYAAWKDREFVYLALEWAPGVSAGNMTHAGKTSV